MQGSHFIFFCAQTFISQEQITNFLFVTFETVTREICVRVNLFWSLAPSPPTVAATTGSHKSGRRPNLSVPSGTSISASGRSFPSLIWDAVHQASEKKEAPSTFPDPHWTQGRSFSASFFSIPSSACAFILGLLSPQLRYRNHKAPPSASGVFLFFTM
ncbi:hypothetical protein MRX96_045363 [Rhipicephalus microplus]